MIDFEAPDMVLVNLPTVDMYTNSRNGLAIIGRIPSVDEASSSADQ